MQSRAVIARTGMPWATSSESHGAQDGCNLRAVGVCHHATSVLTNKAATYGGHTPALIENKHFI